MRVYYNKAIIVLLSLSMLWTISVFLAPATMEPGTVEHLHGTAIMDYEWDGLTPYHQFVYGFGDSQCHQIEERSFYINGNQMPLCARCTSLFLWANLGVIAAMLIRPEYNISEAAIKIFPKRLQNAIRDRRLVMVSWIVLMVLCVLPTAMDGITQLFSDYQSNNLNRIMFSLPTGWFGGFAIGLMVNNVHFNLQDIAEKEGQRRTEREAQKGPGTVEEKDEGEEE